MAINTVANPQVLGSHCNCDVFALVNTNRPSHSCHEDDAIHTLSDLEAVNSLSDIQVAILTGDDSDVFTRHSVSDISNSDAFIEEGKVLWLVKLCLG